MQNQGEVAATRQRIESETIAAARGLYPFAECASHEVITARMEHMCRMADELREVVGEQRMVEILATAMDRQEEH